MEREREGEREKVPAVFCFSVHGLLAGLMAGGGGGGWGGGDETGKLCRHL